MNDLIVWRALQSMWSTCAERGDSPVRYVMTLRCYQRLLDEMREAGADAPQLRRESVYILGIPVHTDDDLPPGTARLLTQRGHLDWYAQPASSGVTPDDLRGLLARLDWLGDP